MVTDPSILLPSATPSLYKDEPELIDYVQLPFHLWIPDFFFPHLVPYMPCPVPGCAGHTARRRWHSGGPRLVHGVHCAMYLHCWEYVCDNNKDKSFHGWDHRVLVKLPPAIQARFTYVFSKQEGVTLELHRQIVEVRVSGSSLMALRNELVRNRYTRMYETIAAYHQHCLRHRELHEAGLKAYCSGQGSSHHYTPMPPILNDPDAYFDHEPPGINFFSNVYHEHGVEQSAMWTRYTQQLTAERVSIDATFKMPKKVANSSVRMLWSMMDIDTGCILQQQLLTHERHYDILPMLSSYAARCRELGVPFPRRVCSDRGRMDAKCINDPAAFPDAHINVDQYHLHALFTKTLNKTSPLWRDAVTAFASAIYVSVPGENGKPTLTHAEPKAIVEAVDGHIKHFSNSGSDQQAAVTQATVKWWADRRNDVFNHRVCSHPVGETSIKRVSSSALENFHRQLNRLFRLVRCSEKTTHAFLMQFMFVWNVDRRRAAKSEVDWKVYDFMLLQTAYEATLAVHSTETASMWKGGFKVPPALTTQEQFGANHHHVTLQERLAAADHNLPFSEKLFAALVHIISNIDPLLSSQQVQSLSASVVSSSSDAASSTPSDHTDTDSSEATPFLSLSSSPSNGSARSARQPATSSQSALRSLSYMEMECLSKFKLFDADMRDAVLAEEWDHAAARWNTLLRRCGERADTRGAARHIHVVHSETIRHGIAVLHKRQEELVEREIVSMKASSPHIPWTPVSASVQPFTVYEDTVLTRMVDNNKKSKKTSWVAICLAWLHQFKSEYISGQNNRLIPRNRHVLKSHYQSLMKRALTSSSLPLSVQHTPLSITVTVPHLAADSATGPSPDESLLEQLVSPTAPPPASSNVSVSSPIILLSPSPPSSPSPASPPSSSIHSVLGAVYTSARQLMFPLQSATHTVLSGPPPLPPLLTNAMLTPTTTPTPTAAPLLLSTTGSSSSSSNSDSGQAHPYHWSPAASAHFIKLNSDFDNRISWKKFEALWPTQQLGPVTLSRFQNKKKVESKKRKRAAEAEAEAIACGGGAAGPANHTRHIKR